MSDRTSHRRRARQQRIKQLRALGGYAPGEPMSVLCNKCGLPCLWQECFENCRRGGKSRADVVDEVR